MNKASAFAPGHISGFFEPVYHPEDINRTGSRGAGININLGSTSEVIIENSNNQVFEIYVNNRKSSAPVTHLALRYLIGDNPLRIIVKTKLDLPMGQGFGMSAAGALSATLATAKITGLSNNDAMRASHFAEVQLRTGLGDVVASCFGGIEIRKNPGLPPWGVIEHIPGKFNLVLCVIGKKVDTRKILSDSSRISNIVNYGKYCTKKLLENPCVENLFSLSKFFTDKTKLADKRVIEAINAVKNVGQGSMCMLGNSVFTIGKSNELCKILAAYGRVYLCTVDEYGACVLES